jgi:hypothetical protein
MRDFEREAPARATAVPDGTAHRDKPWSMSRIRPSWADDDRTRHDVEALIG